MKSRPLLWLIYIGIYWLYYFSTQFYLMTLLYLRTFSTSFTWNAIILNTSPALSASNNWQSKSYIIRSFMPEKCHPGISLTFFALIHILVLNVRCDWLLWNAPVSLFLPRAAGGSKVLVDMRGQISFKGTLTRSDTHPCSSAVHTSDLSDICCSVKVTLGVGQRLGAPLSLFVRGGEGNH